MKSKPFSNPVTASSVANENLPAGSGDSKRSCCSPAPASKQPGEIVAGGNLGLKPFLIGTAASAGVVGFYLGLLTLTSDWYNAGLEFREYALWIIALAIGLGTQAALFTIYREWHRGESIRAAKYGLATSGGISTTAMAACCTHYLAVLLPALGLPFLSAAFSTLADYQVFFFAAGVISNFFGVGMMLRMMHRSGMIHFRSSMIRSPLTLNTGDKGGL